MQEIAQSERSMRALFGAATEIYVTSPRTEDLRSPLRVAEALFQATGRVDSWDEAKVAELKTPDLILRDDGQIRDIFRMLTRPTEFVRDRFGRDQVSRRQEFDGPLPQVFSHTAVWREGQWQPSRKFDLGPTNFDDFLGSPILKAVIIEQALRGDPSLLGLMPAALASIDEYQATMKSELVGQVKPSSRSVMQVSVELSDELRVPRTFMAGHKARLRDSDPATRIAAFYAFAMTGYDDDFEFDAMLQKAAAELDPIWLPAIVNIAVKSDSPAIDTVIDTAIDRIVVEGNIEALELAWNVLPYRLDGDRLNNWLRQALSMPIDTRSDLQFEMRPVDVEEDAAGNAEMRYAWTEGPLVELARTISGALSRLQPTRETAKMLCELLTQNAQKLSAMDGIDERIDPTGDPIDVREFVPEELPLLWLVDYEVQELVERAQ